MIGVETEKACLLFCRNGSQSTSITFKRQLTGKNSRFSLGHLNFFSYEIVSNWASSLLCISLVHSRSSGEKGRLQRSCTQSAKD